MSTETLLSLVKTRSTLVFIQDILLISISLPFSLYLRLGDDLSQMALPAIVFNTFLYVMFGISVFVGKQLYPELWKAPLLNKLDPIVLGVTCMTLLYIPVLFFLPEELSLPGSTPFINGFVLIALLHLPRLISFPYQKKMTKSNQEDQITSSISKLTRIEDLLQRPPLQFDRKRVEAFIKGKRVLLTGAGGTLGAELIRQIANNSPSHICLVDHSEYLLYLADLEAQEYAPKLLRETLLGDVTCRERIRHVISTFKPDFVIHDSSLKQVPFGEGNPSQSVLTNVIGTRNVAEACRDFKVKAMLLISSHEASNPTNTMGATKRLAESYCQALDILDRKKPNGTRFISVRLGNLLEAPGSVVPLFRRQIEKGGPITITHSDAMRNFITTSDAVELALEAMTLAVNLDVKEGRVFALDQGEPIKIMDLARHMIDIANNGDIDIKFIGLRSGEKLIEEASAEQLIPTQNPHLFVVTPRSMDHGFLARALLELEIVAKNQDKDSILRLLQALVPEYKKASFNEDPELVAAT